MMALAKYYEDNYEIAEQRYLAYLEWKSEYAQNLTYTQNKKENNNA